MSVEPRVVDLERWWTSLVSSALVGTARADVPVLPALGLRVRDAGTREVALLDAAAIGGVLRAAGVRTPEQAPPPESCPPEAMPVAPDRAVHLLQLALDQPPVSRELAAALATRWFVRAAEHGRRLPHELLPTVLRAATQRPELRAALPAVLGERGPWLAARRPEWSWAGEGEDAEAPSDDAWRDLPAGEQPAALRRIRAADPARGRALVARESASAGAKQRATVLGCLAVGLSPADEPLLEAALDDRAAAVRTVAWTLLDGLPDSARAHRMAGRLRAAVSVSGRLRKGLSIAPPAEPDESAARDGLAHAPRGVHTRDWYLEQVLAGAPLSVLAEVTRADPSGVLALDRDGVLQRGLLRAVTARGDVTWARAMLERSWDASLVALLPPADREAVTCRAVRDLGADTAVAAVLDGVPGPWGEELSLVVAEWVARGLGTVARPTPLPLRPRAIAALHPVAAPGLLRCLDVAESAEADAARALARRPRGSTPSRPEGDAGRLAIARQNVRALRDAVQYLSFIGLVDEAFS